ncbi:unnamed protein product [Spirodela intermedia]|uniref:Uncharacterized protein n=1 Tax=Spirodela intermedia TaxID=51605 RepID=A0ABN7E863_SPIIN|nr:unnamed protein product [Spirodela intermedia]
MTTPYHPQANGQQVPSLACTTTPCPTASWPPVTWKESGAHVPLLVQAARALLSAALQLIIG